MNDIRYNTPMKKAIALLSLLSCGLLFADGALYYIQNNQKVYLQPYKAQKQMRNVSKTNSISSKPIDYYMNSRGTLLGVTNRLIVKLTSDSIEKYAKAYHLKHIKTLGPHLYLVEVADKNQTIATANALSREPNVRYAHPDFIKKQLLR